MEKQIDQSRASSSDPGDCEATCFEKITSIYDAINKDEVVRYINSNQQLIPFLFEVRQAINEYFPWKKKSKIAFTKDPDVEGISKLFIYIPYEGNVKEAYEKFKRFKKEWFLERYKKIKGLINVDLEYH